MEQPLNCKYVARAIVRIGDELIVGYSHFGHLQACKNATRKYQKQTGGRK